MQTAPALVRGLARIDAPARDRIGALLLAALAVAEVLASELHGARGAILAQTLVVTGATAWRRSSPLGAVVVAAVAAATNPLIYSGTDSDFLVTQIWAVLLLSYSVSAHEERTETAIAGALILLVTFWADDLRQGNPPGEYLGSFVGVAASWLAGRVVSGARRQAQLLREANEELAHQRRRAERAAAEAERLRIARELHDIVAHSLTVVALQADAADALLPARPERAQNALASIRTTAQDALGEMRRLLGTLRSDPEEAVDEGDRGLRDLDALIDGARAGGRRVELQVQGDPFQLPAALDRSAYRIVQEGLTNVRRYADGAPCRVTVRYAEQALELSVSNDRAGAASGVGEHGPGYGLIGVRERAGALGGHVTAGPDPSGGWTLRTRLPLDLPAR